jgi:acetyltransferase-like isoleucine patch superfamily enzyme
MDKTKFKNLFSNEIEFKQNPFHPLVWITGNPCFGKNVYVGAMSEINAKEVDVIIGDNCDIASFVSIHSSDSHKRCLGLSNKIDRKKIVLENNVFVGTHSIIKGGSYIGHHSVIAAGTIIGNVKIPPYSLVIGNPAQIKSGYYNKTKTKTKTYDKKHSFNKKKNN